MSAVGGTGSANASQRTRSMTLGHAFLIYFHNQGRPAGHDVDFVHPQINVSPQNPRQWQNLLRVTASNLIPKLTQCIETSWAATAPLHTSRRRFLSHVLSGAPRSQRKSDLKGTRVSVRVVLGDRL